jgi:hypothetical protein
LQQRLAGTLGVTGMLALALRSPVEQLLRYLAEPEVRRWQALAMIRCLGWFDQASMRSAGLAEQFRQHLQGRCSTGFRDLVEAQPGELACGGLGYAGPAELLSVYCYLPLEAIARADPDRLLVSLRLAAEPGAAGEGLRPAWQGLHRLYNLLQFLPGVELATAQGAAAAAYEAIAWTYARGVLGTAGPTRQAPPPDLAPSQGGAPGQSGSAGAPPPADLTPLQGLLDPALEPHLRRLLQRLPALPEVGFELAGADGAVVAEAELAWPGRHLAVGQPEGDGAVWAAAGWAWIPLDEAGRWVDEVLARTGTKGGGDA